MSVSRRESRWWYLATVISAAVYLCSVGMAVEPWELSEERIRGFIDGSSSISLAARGQMDESHVPIIMEYWNDPRHEVRTRAVEMLAFIPAAATESILAALASNDSGLMKGAFRAVSENVDLVADDRVLTAWADAVGSIQMLRDVPVGISKVILSLDDKRRDSTFDRLLPGVLANLEQYNESDAPSMLIALGRSARLGDERVLSALDRLYSASEELTLTRWGGPRIVDKSPIDATRVVCALLHARANLGDETGTHLYGRRLVTGSPHEQKTCCLFLKSLLPREGAIELAITALDVHDRIYFCGIRGVESQQDEYKRVCDFGVEAIGTWFEEFPLFIWPCKVYTGDEIQMARDLAMTKLAELRKE